MISKEHLLEIPNIITLIRVLLIPVFIILYLYGYPFIAAVVFAITAASDVLDGYLARKHKLITPLGTLLDPIADKLLIIAGLILLLDKIPLWMVLVIITRELFITVKRAFLLRKKEIIAASWPGKLKTLMQVVAITAVMISFPGYWWFMLAAVIFTLYSMVDYLPQLFGRKN